jgi:hypothetical protein
MKMTLPIFILLLIGSSWACDKSEDLPLTDSNYLIFGHYYGLCMGEECIETFKLTANELFEDTSDTYRQTDFNFVPLANDLFERVQDLRDRIPAQLLDEADQTFGCPDCADQGGLLIQFVSGDNVQTWYLDQSQTAVPEYLHTFMDKVNEKIALINE